ncbi:enoyl-CoA hydratase/isomerase family protein [Streptomyces sp. NPDC050625]|uniref:enoyl-CoA hydratase/isomerase family protein n=1 Tax=Streptomyces sp. NPDC050625 TaxID=3154629 RepID=UPI0034322002
MTTEKLEATEEDVLSVEVADGVAVLTMSRPRRLNALNKEMIRAFGDAIMRFEHDPDVRVLVITGGPRTDGRPCFCAGADVHEGAAHGSAGTGEREFDLAREVAGVFDGDHLGAQGIRELWHRLETYPKPVIAAIDGVCTGGGVELAMSCDIRIASRTAQISDLHLTNVGHVGGAGATSRLSRIVGPSMAKQMVWTGQILDGPEALRVGLATLVTEPEKLVETAIDMARATAQRDPVGVRFGKVVANAAPDMSLEQALRYDYLAWTTQMIETDGFAATRAFASSRGKQA